MKEGLVTIRRKRGRIPGFGKPNVPVEVLWCGTNRPRRKHGHRSNGWSFPPRVRELLLQECEGLTVVHLFGGHADFGVRLDLDPATKPDYIGDAFLPPFERDSFDVVILDPPYYHMNRQEIIALMRASAWVARRNIFWLHTVWIATNRHLPLEHAWLIRVGDQCAIRTLQKFGVREPKLRPLQPGEFTRGAPLKYNRWLKAGEKLPFDGFIHVGDDARERADEHPRASNGAILSLPSNEVFLGLAMKELLKLLLPTVGFIAGILLAEFVKRRREHQEELDHRWRAAIVEFVVLCKEYHRVNPGANFSDPKTWEGLISFFEQQKQRRVM